MLVAIITYDQEAYALPTLLKALKAQTEKFDLLFIDNSENEYKQLYQQLKESFPDATVLKADGKDRFDRILNSRKKVREFFLKSKHDSLLMLDSDVIPPPDALTEFVEGQADLASGIYLNASDANGKLELLPCIYIDVHGGAKQATMQDMLHHERLAIGAAGLGCTFVSRKVMEAVDFRLNTHGKGEDIMFYRDAVTKGFKPVALCSIKCLHMHFPAGDARNSRFDAAKYKLENE